MRSSTSQTTSITGIQALSGENAPEAQGFWADAWSQILRRPAAVVGLFWVAVVSIVAVMAPIIASGHPIIAWEISESGTQSPARFPMFSHLTATDWILLLGFIGCVIGLTLPGRATRGQRLGMVLAGAAQAGLVVVIAGLVGGYFSQRDAPDWARSLERSTYFALIATACVTFVCSAPFLLIPSVLRLAGRIALVVGVGLVAGLAVWSTWSPPLDSFEYADRERAGQLRAVYTAVPWSPNERPRDRDAKLLKPGSTSDQPLFTNIITGLPITGTLSAQHFETARSRVDTLPLPQALLDELREVIDQQAALDPPAHRRQLSDALKDALSTSGRPYYLGTDSFGQDVLTQIIHACRLAVSIGLVSTGIATLIGVTLGALMGYFGGLVDLLLYRVVEIFMAIPLLFILIVAAGVLPPEYRSTYVMMAIIGCFTWTGAARYTRAEFYKLRNQDFVQSARAVGLPLRSILFRHMLPNGITPVLVDASFAIAFAIILEATLSFLGLGPSDQASWGRLLSDATGPVGDFIWWLAIFPGLAIFLAALSYNLIGEALRDAIDPKLKKARV